MRRSGCEGVIQIREMTRRTGTLLFAALALGGASTLSGQTASNFDVATRCEAAGLPPEGLALCHDVATAVELTQPELGLVLAGGNPVLGTASPIGTKFRWLPRMFIGGRLSFVWAEIPDILNYPDVPTEPVGKIDFSVTMPQLDLSVSVFDGFMLNTTLGGFASVELLGSLGPMILPAGAGFQNDATGWGLGARIGVLRESFTAPGISVSGMYKSAGRIRYGSVADGDDAQFSMDLDVASFRAGISKSFVAIGLAFTLGYDHYSSNVAFGVADAQGDLIPVVPESAPVDLSSSRWSAFVDVSYIVLFFNIVAEFGWQETQTLATSTGTELTSGKWLLGLGLRFSL